MDYQAVNESLDAIVELRNRLYNERSQKQKHEIDKELRVMEANFLNQHGDVLHEVMLDVQDEYFSDSDMAPIMHYVAQQYRVVGNNNWGNEYQTDPNDGVPVTIDDFPDKSTHLVIIPNPLRVVLHIDSITSHLVWTSQKPSYVS